ncbi:MAG TPA: glycoside hydrolase N-terminal domain-containing protein [Candidatus Latescibacteria bacterium]|nr:glycoside hydrolase N-terminal domain-containing protein [Candidatus Latescibacterota bacterium]
MANAGASQPLPRHDLLYERASDEWNTGAPLGNGQLGVMVWGDGNPLRLTLDRDDLWDLRVPSRPDDPSFTWQNLKKLAQEEDWETLNATVERNLNPPAPTPTKLPLGRLEIEFRGTSSNGNGFRGRLSLKKAEFSATFGGNRVKVFVCAHAPVVVVECYGESASPLVFWRSFRDLNPGQAASLGIQPCDSLQIYDITAAVQRFPDGTTAVVAWHCAPSAGGFVVRCTVATSADGDDPVSVAADRLRAATSTYSLKRRHREWWSDFWSRSSITIPEKRLETLWYYGLYKLASSSRPGNLPANLQGLWVTDGVLPPWRGDYHANMNIQETYWPVYATNHLEIGLPLLQWIESITEPARQRTRSFFGWDGVRIETALAPNGVPVPGWGTVQYWPGAATWLAHHLWLHWRYSGDRNFLREKAFPFFQLCFAFWEGYLEKGTDGYLHVPLSHSPEWNGNLPEAWGRDPVIDLSLIRNLCLWLDESARELRVSGEMQTRWKVVAESLAPYPRDPAGGLMLMEGVPLSESHRHPSHLMPVFPMHDMSAEGTEEDRKCIEVSLAQLERKGMGEWTGWSFPYVSLIASRVGRACMAEYMLKLYIESFVLPNGCHANGDWRGNGICQYHYSPFTMEAECAATSAVTEMMLQSWGGTIRLFPAVPETWLDASFHGFLAEGGIEVSAVREFGETTEVTLRSRDRAEARVVGLKGNAQWRGAASARWETGTWVVTLDAGVPACGRCHRRKTGKRRATESNTRNIFGLRI